MTTLDDFLNEIPDDEKNMIALGEVWDAAINATLEILLQDAHISEQDRNSWTESADKIRETPSYSDFYVEVL